MTHLDQLFTHLHRHVTNIRQKYTDFSNGVVQAIIEEDMKIRSEEINSRATSPNPREGSPDASPQ
ncbi:MAG: hypothetical protein WCF88_14930 [Candidatus Acidiferrales bacterium]|jgi:hypothetical protein